jgi:hypothetical protein
MPNNIVENLSNDQLKAGYWYVTHRVILRKVGIMILAIFSGILLLFGVKGLVDYYIMDRPTRLAIESSIVNPKLNNNLLKEINTPRTLQIIETNVIKKDDKVYDIATEVFNPNAQWYVKSFDYYYKLGDEKTNTKEGYILPGQNKFVLYLNYRATGNFSGAQIMIENIEWEKVANYAEMQEKFISFVFEDATILSPNQSGLSDNEKIANLSFTVLNKSTYNYHEPKFIIFLYKGGSLEAVTQTVLDSIMSGEKKTDSFNLFQSIPRGTDMIIVPDINILDPTVFKGFDVGPGTLK